jgi:hypothetical protein
VNRMKGTLARLGIRNFRPTLRKAAEHLAALYTPEGSPLPPNVSAELERDIARLGVVIGQIVDCSTRSGISDKDPGSIVSSLIATWFSEGRRAQHPPVPCYPLGICRPKRSRATISGVRALLAPAGEGITRALSVGARAFGRRSGRCKAGPCDVERTRRLRIVSMKRIVIN